MDTDTEPAFATFLNPLRAGSSLYRQRGLLWQFAWRNLEIRHRGSFLGMVWAVLNPLLALLLYVFVFGYIFGGSFGVIEGETKWDYGMGIFLGLAIFHMVSESIAAAPTTVTSSPNFVKKVVFPLEILPAASVGASLIHLTITLSMVLIGAGFSSQGLSVHALLLPVVLLPGILFTLGWTWMFAALGVFLRDVTQIIGLITMGLLFASGIFYSADRVREMPEAWALLRFNPVLHIVDMARDVLLWHQPISFTTLGILYVGGLATALVGYAAFEHFKHDFAEVL